MSGEVFIKANDGNGKVGIGLNAGQTSQGAFSVAMGYGAGVTAQGTSATAVGRLAGQTSQGNNAVAVGVNAGLTAQGTYATAVGVNAGQTSQGAFSVAMGYGAGVTSQGSYAVAVGNSAGQTSQGASATAVGINAGRYTQGSYATAVGNSAGETSQGNFAVAVGHAAGETSQAAAAVAVGVSAGKSNQGQYAIAVGRFAGETSQGNYATALGVAAGQFNQGVDAVAVGNSAGQTSQGIYAVAVGVVAGQTSQGTNAVAVGRLAGNTSQGNEATAVGYIAGETSQGTYATAVGVAAGRFNQGSHAVAVGVNSAITSQGNSAVAVGYAAGLTSQGSNAVAVGREAGQTSQGDSATALGYLAGQTSQGASAVAVGYLAGHSNQGGYTVAVGLQTGQTSQGTGAIAAGHDAGRYNQGSYATAVGNGAGLTSQGSNAVAVGNAAGQTNQHDNTVVLNASGSALNTAQASSFYVKPVRGGNFAASALAYTSAGEVVEETGVHFDASGNVGIGTASPSSKLHIDNGVLVVSDTSETNPNYLIPDGDGSGVSSNEHLTGNTHIGVAQFVSEPSDYNFPSVSIINKDRVGNTTKNANIGFFLTDTVGTSKYAGRIGFWPESADALTNQFRIYTTDTSAGYTYPVQQMVVTGDGNVGIGTTSPYSKLDTRGDTIVNSGEANWDTGMKSLLGTQDLIDAGVYNTGSISASTDVDLPPEVVNDVIAKFVNSDTGEVVTGNPSVGYTLSIGDDVVFDVWIYNSSGSTISSEFFIFGGATQAVGFGIPSNSTWTKYTQTITASAAGGFSLRMDNNTAGKTFYFTGLSVRVNPSNTTNAPFTPKGFPLSGTGTVLSVPNIVAKEASIQTLLGNVGIGTTSPQGLLHISSGTSGDAHLILEADTDNDNESDNPKIVFRQDGGYYTGEIGLGGSGNNRNRMVFRSKSTITANTGFIFYSNVTPYTSTTDIDDLEDTQLEVMRITGDGNVGIGAISPSTALDVNGTVTCTALVETSDDRIKYNEQSVSNALTLINQLRPQKYEKISKVPASAEGVWIPTDAEWESVKSNYEYKDEFGFIAQDVRAVPELTFLVHGEETRTDVKTVSLKEYSNLTTGEQNTYTEQYIYVSTEDPISLENYSNLTPEEQSQYHPTSNVYTKNDIGVDEYSNLTSDVQQTYTQELSGYTKEIETQTPLALDYKGLFVLAIGAIKELEARVAALESA
jgi:hypothetical protein